MANELRRGEPRLGFIYDGIPDTPYVSVELRRTDDDIEFRLPWTSEYNGLHQRWFAGQSAHWGDDPDQSRYSYEVPDRMLFEDEQGSVVLVGCRSAGYTTNVLRGIGTATVDFAVLGARDATRYDKVNGIRSEVEGLGSWLGVRSLTHGHTLNDDNRIDSLTLTLKAPPPAQLARALNLTAIPSFRSGAGAHPDQTVVDERYLVQTFVTKPRDWWEHLDLHFAIRDLMRLATWRRLNFLAHESTRDDDPIRMLDGSRKGRAWRSVETGRTAVAAERLKVSGLDLLFRHQDVSSTGLAWWVDLHRREPRVVQPFLRLLELSEASIETHIAQMGMGFDALGFKLALAAGLSRSKAKEESIEARISRVADGTRAQLPFDRHDAAARISTAYNSVKHANRAVPAGVDLVLAYRMGIQLFRAWSLVGLGVSPETATSQLERDRISREIAFALAEARAGGADRGS